MKIAITMYTLQDIREYMRILLESHRGIITKYNRGCKEITLVNGDMIKGYTINQQRDGVRSDVAIGIDAQVLTVGSKIEGPVWNLEKLSKYLSNIGRHNGINR